MNYTKGKWDYKKTPTNYVVTTDVDIASERDEGIIADVYSCFAGSAESNAILITSAVNACISINPGNPLVVAESIKDMYESTKIAMDLVKFVLYEHPDDEIAQAQKIVVEKTLNKLGVK